jgi:hypothetical protein
MYKIVNLYGKSAVVIRLSDNAGIPFDNANSDFAQFKKDLANGAELQDAEGNVIDGIAYLKELS